jgi:hypothetical protein
MERTSKVLCTRSKIRHNIPKCYNKTRSKEYELFINVYVGPKAARSSMCFRFTYDICRDLFSCSGIVKVTGRLSMR